MATGQKLTVVVSSISFVKTTGNFIINEASSNAMWLNAGFIKNIYSSLGLSTKTSFQLLKGCTIRFYKLEVTDEMLAAGGGKHSITSNIGNNRPIEFKTKGVKFFDHSVLSNSAALDNAIMSSGVVLDDSWAGDAKPAATPSTPAINVPKAEITEEAGDDGGDHVNLDEAAGAEVPPANAEVAQQ